MNGSTAGANLRAKGRLKVDIVYRTIYFGVSEDEPSLSQLSELEMAEIGLALLCVL